MLDIVHVIPVDVPVDVQRHFPDGSLQAFGAAVLDEAVGAAREARPDLTVATHLLSGGRVDQLLEFARGAELLILGSRPISTLEILWTGDTGAGVASQAAIPVLSVPSSWRNPEPTRRVVVGYKSPSTSWAPLGAGFVEAQRRGSELLVLHTWRLPGAYDDVVTVRMDDERWNRAERTRIEEEIAELHADHPEVSVRVHVTHGRPAQTLVTESRSADLLVLSRPLHGGSLHHVGGTVRRVLRLSECPILIVPPRPAGP
jgi:nucleotide-binding universal stress UspA family protein